MDTPQISRSGRVLKKSAKVKEMEDFDINELDMQGKARKKSKTMDDYDEFDDKRVAPIKIPKISLNVQGAKRKAGDMSPSIGKQMFKSPIQGSMKGKQDPRHSIYNDSSDGSKESDSSSVSSETSSSSSSSSSDASEDEDPYNAEYRNERKVPLNPGLQNLSVHQDKVIVEQNQQRAAKPKALSAYMLWCGENRKKIAASSGNIGFGNIGKKMGEAWQALPEKEKLAWRRKAKQLALKGASNVINSGPSNIAQTKTASRASANLTEELLKGLTENAGILGTAPIDAAAHLKLLGDSLTVIGQRLIEHEGQLAVSGIYSVLLDTLLCAIGPLLCLATEVTGLENLQTDICKKTLDHIAYFMPGL